MNKFIKYSVIITAYLAVLFPLWVRISVLSWAFDSTLLSNLFPLFGLTAFSVLWLHSMSGVFESWLRGQFNFDRFVHISSVLILFCIILHPLLLFVMLDFKFDSLLSSESAKYIRLGVVGWLLLITYDLGKVLKRRYHFFVRNWSNILLISTIGFLLTFFHSLGLGSDLQSGALRAIWIFYGITAILATIWTYGVKRFIKKDRLTFTGIPGR